MYMNIYTAMLVTQTCYTKFEASLYHFSENTNWHSEIGRRLFPNILHDAM